MDFKTRLAIRAVIVFTLFAAVGVFHINRRVVREPTIMASKITDDLARERVECEFDRPIGIIVSVMHYYASYEDVNLVYKAAGGKEDDVWGWSLCEWQPSKNYAACDIHTVLPEFVEGDVMHTIGHEIWHGACGMFHE